MRKFVVCGGQDVRYHCHRYTGLGTISWFDKAVLCVQKPAIDFLKSISVECFWTFIGYYISLTERKDYTWIFCRLMDDTALSFLSVDKCYTSGDCILRCIGRPTTRHWWWDLGHCVIEKVVPEWCRYWIRHGPRIYGESHDYILVRWGVPWKLCVPGSIEQKRHPKLQRCY